MASLTVAPLTPERQVTPIAYHPVMLALGKASAALALIRGIAYGNIELAGEETNEWARGIALDALGAALEEASEAFTVKTDAAVAVV